MCGIGGFLRGQESLDPSEVGRRMVEALQHRGPDGHGTTLLPGGRGVLAHTRLAIIDLSERARQPFSSRDGQVCLVFNGEIYDYRALRRELLDSGVELRSDSDTEVILELYLRHGEQGLDRLDGMFAIALWDARVERLILMRDRVGKKPLYWARTPGGGLAFGSEVKSLAPCLELELDADRLPEYLTFGYVETPRSFYKGVSRVPPATRLSFERDGSMRSTRYWSLDGIRPEPMDVEDAKQAVRRAVGAAVERRMIADVPLGAFLSGGVDSSIIVAEMAARSSRPVRTFCAGFEADASFDERSFARQIANQLGTEHTDLVVKSAPEADLSTLLHHHDEPYGDSSAIALYAVAAATRKHVTVALSGDGGDEVFAGYTRFRGGLLSALAPPLVGKAVRRALRGVGEPRGYKHPLALLRRFVEHAERSPDEQLLAWNSYFAGRALADLLRPELVGASFDPWQVLEPQCRMLAELANAGRDRLDCILRHNLASYLLDDLLVKADRATMAVALEARSPFLDTQVIELAFRIPSSLKMRFGSLKWLLKQAYADVLPREIMNRKKHGFGVPLSRWWSGPLSPMVRELLLPPSARLGAYLRPDAVRGVVEDHMSGRKDHGQRIFLLLNLELWLRSQA